jgi:hypothetical protein
MPQLHSQGCSNPKDILTVQLFDDCDQCEANQVNLLATPFSRMANIDVGRVKIQYREVRTVTGPCRQQITPPHTVLLYCVTISFQVQTYRTTTSAAHAVLTHHMDLSHW